MVTTESLKRMAKEKSNECHDGADKVTLNLHKVLFVPEIKKNLLSVPAMTQMQAEVIFDEEKCYIIKN